MRTVAGYISREIARTGGIVLVIMVMAFVLERTLRIIRDVDPSQLPLGLAASMLFWKLPEILAIALPPAFFAGMLLTFQRLVRDGELDALYASGLGLSDLAPSLLRLTGGAVALMILVFWFLLPQGKYQYAALTHRAAQVALGASVKAGSFFQLEGNVFYVQPASASTAGQSSIFIYETGPRNRRFVTTATIEAFEISRDRGSLFLSARDGQRVQLATPDHSTSSMTFTHARNLIHAVDRGRFRDRGEDAEELTLPELLATLKQSPGPARAQRAWAELHVKLARVAAMLLLPFAALALALALPVPRQWIGVTAGVVLMLALDQCLILGEATVRHGGASPWLGLWGTIGLFTAMIGCAAAVAGLRCPRARW